MQDIQKTKFFSPTKGNLNFEEVTKEIFNYLKEKPEKFYDIVVGCDSSSGVNISFPVAIVVLRVGFGGRFFLKKIKHPQSFSKRFQNIHQRVLNEILISCEIALDLRETLEKKFQESPEEFNYQFRYIHADVGKGGKTKDMIKEVVGLIKSNGFEAKIKPEAFAASVVADRFT